MTSIIADFTWTPEELRRMRRTWLRYTDQGRTHRRNVHVMFCVGVAGLAGGVVVLAKDGVSSGGIMLTLAAGVLLGFLYLIRPRIPAEVLSREQVRWTISLDRLIVETGKKREEVDWAIIRRVLRTPDGFMLWRSNGFEIWLPVNAFAGSGEIESFSQIAQSKAEKYASAA